MFSFLKKSIETVNVKKAMAMVGLILRGFPYFWQFFAQKVFITFKRPDLDIDKEYGHHIWKNMKDYSERLRKLNLLSLVYGRD